MLRELRVRDLALVERAALELGPGLSVLTGETGAGKSLLVAAIAVLRGGRTSAELVRQGAEAAVVEAVFDGGAAAAAADRLAALGLEAGDELLLRRIVGRDGRSRAFVNDQAVTAATLRELGSALVDLHGQHEAQLLLDEASHARLLDEAAGLARARSEVQAARARLRAARDALAAAAAERARIAGAAAALEAVAAEVEALAPHAGEIEALRAEREILRHRDKIAEVMRAAGRHLGEEDGAALERVGIVEGLVRSLEGLDPSVLPLRQQLFEARLLLEEAMRAAERRLSQLEEEPARLEALEGRLARLESLARRHGGLEGALAAAAAARRDLERLADPEDRTAREEVVGALAGLEAAAAALSAGRGRGARKLARRVGEELAALGFPAGAFEARLEARPGAGGEALAPVAGREAPWLLDRTRLELEAIGDDGREAVRFLIAPNPGEGFHPLGRTAAGGELARLMLALRTALRGAGGARVLVFDEVDSGVGGTVLDAVADRLAALARERQVLCVTHQPRIAARADRHVRVDKRVEGGRTVTRLELLDRAGRIGELERLLAGRAPGPRAAALAEELLARHDRGGRAFR